MFIFWFILTANSKRPCARSAVFEVTTDGKAAKFYHAVSQMFVQGGVHGSDCCVSGLKIFAGARTKAHLQGLRQGLGDSFPTGITSETSAK
jgi:hypothetical protein